MQNKKTVNVCAYEYRNWHDQSHGRLNIIRKDRF